MEEKQQEGDERKKQGSEHEAEGPVVHASLAHWISTPSVSQALRLRRRNQVPAVVSLPFLGGRRRVSESVSGSVRLPQAAALQASLSMELARQENWSGLSCPLPGESSQPRDRTQASCIAGRFFTI